MAVRRAAGHAVSRCARRALTRSGLLCGLLRDGGGPSSATGAEARRVPVIRRAHSAPYRADPRRLAPIYTYTGRLTQIGADSRQFMPIRASSRQFAPMRAMPRPPPRIRAH